MLVSSLPTITLPKLRDALEASWDPRTAYLGVNQPGNGALGQCYPTARVVQWFFLRLEIAFGEVDTGSALEAHFWNVDLASEPTRHIDLTWQQFADGSKIASFKVLDRHQLNDSRPTVARCQLLLKRVLLKLEQADSADQAERDGQSNGRTRG